MLLSHYANNIPLWLGFSPISQCFFAGAVGVELFFVLSGFLIGGLLIKIAETNPSLQNLRIFLVRRWLRTLPLYFLTLFVLMIALPPVEPIGTTLLKFGTMTQNLAWPFILKENGYFFSVSWSLAVEEWFYVVFGSAVILLSSLIGGRRGLIVSLAAVMLCAMLIRLSISSLTSDTVVYRFDDIAYGVVAAVLYQGGSALFSKPFAIPLFILGLGIVATLWSGAISFPPVLNRTIFYTVLAIGCAMFLPLATLLRRPSELLAIPITLISRVSYGLYLFHEPVLLKAQEFSLGSHLINGPTATTLTLIIPFLLAHLSFRYFESPLLALRPSQRALGPSRDAPGLALRSLRTSRDAPGLAQGIDGEEPGYGGVV